MVVVAAIEVLVVLAMVEITDSSLASLGTILEIRPKVLKDGYTGDDPTTPSNAGVLANPVLLPYTPSYLSSRTRRDGGNARLPRSGPAVAPVVLVRGPPAASVCGGKFSIEVEVSASFGRAIDAVWSCRKVAAGQPRDACWALTGTGSSGVSSRLQNPLIRVGEQTTYVIVNICFYS